MELPKAYDWKEFEDQIYTRWDESGYFNPDNLPGDRTENFSVMMPPPNVTGILHLGHALENSIMDIKVRYERMAGKKTLLIPGTDHAALPTQARVEDNLKKSGIQNPRQELGREGLLKEIRDYAEQSKATILSQIRKMGTSADWSRLAYTFDEERSLAVNTVFKKMYEDGLIYRGYRVINWSVVGQSTASDDELEYTERTTTLYTFKYSKDIPIPIATVLPETKLGDTAIAVHPTDERYAQYVGQEFSAELDGVTVNLKVIADEAVDPAYGTGALGVTPAHSHTDFELGQKNNLPLVTVIGQDGNITNNIPGYAGLPVKEARAKFVQWLRDNDLMVSEQEITHNVALSDRFKDEIWPLPMDQWFVNVNKEIPGRGKTLKDFMREAVTTGHDGDINKKVQIAPERFEKVYLHWIENLHDWCISRQIWWGHRIPVWKKGNEQYVGVTPPIDDGWEQDPDTLDTWFSSGMWTFSTLQWPNDSTDMRNFHPATWMQMGYEIVFLWMARMILFSTYSLDDIPFKNVYIHGILRDKNGKKFSKSLGNGMDPIEMIEKYGTDALRFSVIKGTAPGNDARFYEEKVEDGRNFVNKLWNVSRYVLMNEATVQSAEPSLADQWIQSRTQKVITQVTNDLENDEFSRAAECVYQFLWNDFADWYIEITKFQPNPELTRSTLETILKLAHPFIPFVTERIWQELGYQDLLMITAWPKVETVQHDERLEKQFAQLQDIVIQIRNLRGQYKIPYSKNITLYTEQVIDPAEQMIIEKITKVDVTQGAASGVTTQLTNSAYTFLVELGSVIDTDAEKQRLQKEIDQLQKYTSGLEKKLRNPQYTDNAPADVIQKDRDNLKEKQETLDTLKKSLTDLSA